MRASVVVTMDASELVLRDVLAAGNPDPLQVKRALAEVTGRLFEGAGTTGTLDRYVVGRRLGRGGSAVVYAAYDPQLEREVAIKILHCSSVLPETLVREARALARVAHPNVLTVYDVGQYWSEDSPRSAGTSRSDGTAPGVFVVMEHVRGETLAQWERRESTWARRLEVLLAAGRGLAAAHASGVVHGDFKPANVLIGEDDRVLVSDFGLARIAAGGDGTASLGDRPGAGTPRYMAPEQHRGQLADARSDQFSYCVAAFEVLFGVPPFPDAGIVPPGSVATDRRIEWPRRSVPGRVRRALARGLSIDPSARFSDMSALLDALSGTRQRRVVRGALFGAALLGVAVASSLVQARRDARTSIAACEQHIARIDAIWNDAAKRDVQTAFAATRSEVADPMWQSVSAAVGRYAVSLGEQRREACRVAVSSTDEPPQHLEHQIACLDHGAARLADLVELLADADGRVVERAMHAVGSLPPVEACWHAGSDAVDRHDVAWRRRFGSAEMALEAGRYDDAERRVADIERGEHGDDPRLAAYAALLRGRLAYARGEGEDAIERLFAAEIAAEAIGADALVIEALVAAMPVLSESIGRYDEADRVGQRAVVRSARHTVRPELEVELALQRGRLRTFQGRYAEAQGILSDAVNRAGEYALSEIGIARLRIELGKALHKSGDFEAADGEYEIASATWQRVAGPRHPIYAELLHRRSVTAMRRHDYPTALRLAQQSLTEALRAGRRVEAAEELDQLGIIYGEIGRFEDALEHHERAVAVLQDVYPARHPAVARVTHNRGRALFDLGRLDEAMANFELSLRTWQSVAQPVPVAMAHAWHSIGRVHALQGRHDEAQTAFEHAFTLRRQGYELDHPKLVESAVALALTYHRAGRVGEAIELLDPVQHALEIEPSRALERKRVAEVLLQLRSGAPVGEVTMVTSPVSDNPGFEPRSPPTSLFDAPREHDAKR